MMQIRQTTEMRQHEDQKIKRKHHEEIKFSSKQAPGRTLREVRMVRDDEKK